MAILSSRIERKIQQGNLEHVEKKRVRHPLEGLVLAFRYLERANESDDARIRLQAMAGLARQAHTSANTLLNTWSIQEEDKTILNKRVILPARRWFYENHPALESEVVDIHEHEIDWPGEHRHDVLVSDVRGAFKDKLQIASEVGDNFNRFMDGADRAATLSANGVYLVQAARHFPEAADSQEWMVHGLVMSEQAHETLPNPDRWRTLNKWALQYWIEQGHMEEAKAARTVLAAEGIGFGDVLKDKLKEGVAPVLRGITTPRSRIENEVPEFEVLFRKSSDC